MTVSLADSIARARSLAGRAKRALGRSVDRTLHPLRRRAALSKLADLRPASILFVCLGNICRSPFAAAAFIRSLPDAGARPFRVDSAGFIGPGRNTPPEGQLAAQELGIDLSSHVSRLLNEEDAHRFSLVVVMDTDQRRLLSQATAASRVQNILVLGDLDPGPVTARAIADPYGQPVEVFRHIYARIERCTSELARAVVR